MHTPTRLSPFALAWAFPALAFVPLIAPSPLSAQTIGVGSLNNPAVGPAPAYDYGYGTGVNSAVLIKNWDFGTGAGSTITNIGALTTHFQYHDQFGRDAGTEYGSSIVAPPGAPTVSGQPVEGVNTAPGAVVREFLPTSLKTYLVPLNGATIADPALRNVGNGGFQAQWAAPAAGSSLGMDIIWETRVRMVLPPYFWFAIWTAGQEWSAEIDVVESYGYNKGPSTNNFAGSYWHSAVFGVAGAVPSQAESTYNNWGVGMSNNGITGFDPGQWHTWTMVYRADNTMTSYLDGIPIQRGEIAWLERAGAPLNMSFIFDGAWGHQTVPDMRGFTLPMSELSGKYYEWDYSRVYYRVPSPLDRKNFAIQGTISGFSGQQSANVVTKLIDGIYDSDDNRWTPNSTSYPQWAEIDLGTNRKISGTHLVGASDRSYRFKIEAKPAGGTYSTIVDRTSHTLTTPLLTDNFASVTARYVKLTVVGASNYSGGWTTVRELQIWGANPLNPADNLAPAGSILSVNNQQSANPATRLIDGIDNTDDNRWSSNNTGYPRTVEIDLGGAKQINATELVGTNNRSFRFRIEAKLPGGAYQTIVDRTAHNLTTPVISDELAVPVIARHVKLTVTGASNYTGGWTSLREFKIFGTAVPSSNLAPGGTVVAWSSQQAANPATRLIDGLDNDNMNRWTPNGSGYPHWVEIDLGADKVIDGTTLIGSNDRSFRFRIEARTAAGSYATIVDRTTHTLTTPTIADSFAPVTARYVKLTVTGASNYGGGWATIRELRINGPTFQ